MTCKAQLFGLVFLVCISSFGGCGSLGERTRGLKDEDVKRTPAEEKKANLLKAIDRKFEDPDAHFELGQLYQADGLWAQAEYHYNIALGFDPAHWGTQAAMVKVLLDSGDTAKAKLYAEIYMNQASGSAGASLQLALGFQKEQVDEYALDCYRQALHLAPNSAKINRQVGFYYLSKGKKGHAKDYLTRSFQLDRSQPEVAGQLGRLGVAIAVPQKAEEDTGKLDKTVEESDEELTQETKKRRSE